MDSISSGLKPKENVQLATTNNIDLNGIQTIDGVSGASGYRILVQNQTDSNGLTGGTNYIGATGNGIYIMNVSTWSRSSDFSDGYNSTGAFTYVEWWQCK